MVARPLRQLNVNLFQQPRFPLRKVVNVELGDRIKKDGKNHLSRVWDKEKIPSVFCFFFGFLFS